MSRCLNVHFTDLRYVFVATTTDADQYGIVGAPPPALRSHPAHRMGALERGNDAFQTAQQLESLECFPVRNGDVRRATNVFQVRVLRTHAGIIETRRDGMRRVNLTGCIL